MLILLILVLCVCVVYSWWSFRRYSSFGKYLNELPGPPVYPLFGNLLQLGRRPHEHFQIVRGYCRKYNYEMFRLYGGSQPYVIISNPKDLEVILTSTQLLYKDDLYNLLRPWLGYGLLTSFGARWHKHRKMITPSFHFQILQDFLKGMNDTTDKFIGLLKSFSKNEAIFDVQPLVARSTLDVICDTAMGVEVNSINGADNNIVKALNSMCHVVEERVFSVIQRSELLFKLTSTYRKQKRALKMLRNELSIVIEKRRRIVLQNLKDSQGDQDFKKPKMAFLDNLITANVDGRPLSFEEIFEEVSTFIFEGHDTTASAIIFTLYCLSRHPEVQQKTFEEQKMLYGSDLLKHPSYRDLQDMKYLELVIKETLRMYPPVPVIARTTTEFVEINGKLIPPSTTLLMLLIAPSFDERNFQRPLEFLPERFQTDAREFSNPFEYVPFSAGPRNCIGQKFAMMELKCTISKIIRHFEVLPPQEGMPMFVQDPRIPNHMSHNMADPLLAAFVTLKSETGLWIRLRERKY